MSMMLTFWVLTVHLRKTATPYFICHSCFGHIFTGWNWGLCAKVFSPSTRGHPSF